FPYRVPQDLGDPGLTRVRHVIEPSGHCHSFSKPADLFYFRRRFSLKAAAAAAPRLSRKPWNRDFNGGTSLAFRLSGIRLIRSIGQSSILLTSSPSRPKSSRIASSKP